MKISRKGKVQRKETKIPRPKVEKSEIYAYFVLVKKIEERSRQVDSTGILAKQLDGGTQTQQHNH